jgi:hypothetical protein
MGGNAGNPGGESGADRRKLPTDKAGSQGYGKGDRREDREGSGDDGVRGDGVTLSEGKSGELAISTNT